MSDSQIRGLTYDGSPTGVTMLAIDNASYSDAKRTTFLDIKEYVLDGIDTTDSFTTGMTFNTSSGIVTATRNDGGIYQVDLDGRYQLSGNSAFVGTNYRVQFYDSAETNYRGSSSKVILSQPSGTTTRLNITGTLKLSGVSMYDAEGEIRYLANTLWVNTGGTANDWQEVGATAAGTSGTDGTDGTSGSSGTSGADGTDGTSGTDGTDGTDGTSGTDGTDGTSGADGTDGTSGSSGTDGTSGSSGSGTDGTSGADGTDGTSGSSGSSGTSGTITGVTFDADYYYDTAVDRLYAPSLTMVQEKETSAHPVSYGGLFINRSSGVVYSNDVLKAPQSVLPIRIVISGYTLNADTDYTVISNSSGQTINLTIPLAETTPGQVFVVKNLTASGTTNIVRTSPDFVEEDTSVVLPAFHSYMLHSDGLVTWHIIAAYQNKI